MIRVRQIKIDAHLDQEKNITKKLASRLKIKEKEIQNYQIKKQSLDARDKNIIFYVYDIDVEVLNEEYILNYNKDSLIIKTPKEEYQKIEALNKFIYENSYEVDIEVDGGINEKNAKEVTNAGANILVAGSYITNSKDYAKAIKMLKQKM